MAHFALHPTELGLGPAGCPRLPLRIREKPVGKVAKRMKDPPLNLSPSDYISSPKVTDKIEPAGTIQERARFGIVKSD